MRRGIMKMPNVQYLSWTAVIDFFFLLNLQLSSKIHISAPAQSGLLECLAVNAKVATVLGSDPSIFRHSGI